MIQPNSPIQICPSLNQLFPDSKADSDSTPEVKNSPLLEEKIKKVAEESTNYFSFSKLEKKYHLEEISAEIKKIVKCHKVLTLPPSSTASKIVGFFKKDKFGSKLEEILQAHKWDNLCFTREINRILLKLGEISRVEKGSSKVDNVLDFLLDSKRTIPKINSPDQIRQTRIELVGALSRLHIHFLEKQKEHLKNYQEVLENQKEFLYSSRELGEKRFNLYDDIENVSIQIAKSLNKIEKKVTVIEKEYEKYATDNRLNKNDWWQIFKDCGVLYLKYQHNPEGFLQHAIKALDEIREYILKNPSIEARAIMNNLVLAHKLLIGDDPNFELLARQTEKTLFFDDITCGFSTDTSSLQHDQKMPENIRRFANILHVLPTIIAVFEGMKSGSFLPLISLSLFAETLGLSFACIFPLINILFGALENTRSVRIIQNVYQILSQEQRLKLVSFLKILDQKFATMEELNEQRLIMGSFREFITIDKGGRSNHIFSRAKRNLKDFYLKLKLGTPIERKVRLIGQVAIPSVILTSSVVAVSAAFVGLAPVGAVLISVLFAACATITGGAYASYSVGHNLSRWIDEYYHTTVNAAIEQSKFEEQKDRLETFLRDNEDILTAINSQVNKQLSDEVAAGSYDTMLASSYFETEFAEILAEAKDSKKNDIAWRRKQFLKRKHRDNKEMIEAASFIKSYELSTEETDVLFEKLLNLNEGKAALLRIFGSNKDKFDSEAFIADVAKKEGVILTEKQVAFVEEMHKNSNQWDQILQIQTN